MHSKNGSFKLDMTVSRHALMLVAAVMAISPLTARDAVNVAHSINADTTSTIRVIQSSALDAFTTGIMSQQESVGETEQHEAEPELADGQTRVAGYRVQVFSDNNQRTAKGEARSKEKLMRESFPDYGTYVVYNSPFWRLKVGDFRTMHEAEAAADEIKSRFPSFAREVRVVRDRVNYRR